MRGVLCVLTGCGVTLAAGQATGADLAELKQAGVITAIVAADEQAGRFNPDASGAPGFERELLESFARLHGLEVQAVVVPRYMDRIPSLVGGTHLAR